MARDRSGPRDPYFMVLQDTLLAAGVTQPALVVDRDRLDANLDRLRADVPHGSRLRVVAKSLPSLTLLSRVLERTGTDRVMTFNAAMLREIAIGLPEVDQLLGKPVPVAAARALLADGGPVADARVRWLLDTGRRVREYAELGRSLDRVLEVALELDVGLRRGGFAPGTDLERALRTLASSEHLRLTATVGYDAHLAKLPTALGARSRGIRESREAHTAALAQVERVLGAVVAAGLVRNGAGSPTFSLATGSPADEVSVGSVVLKPGDFDLAHLSHYEPAAWIATPALKVLGPMRTPGLERFDAVRLRADPNRATRVFLHGGWWRAEPVDPPGLRTDPTYGRSTNQELLVGGRRVDLAPDDLVFLRPSQSEVVLTQLGDLVAVAGGEVVDRWPAFPPSG